MPLWCQSDPVVKLSYKGKHAVIRILAKSPDQSLPNPAAEQIEMNFATPAAAKAKVIKEANDPRLPIAFTMQEDPTLVATEHELRCSLVVAIPDALRGRQIIVVVKERHKQTLKEYTFRAGYVDTTATLRFYVQLEAEDHSQEIVADSSTWT